MFFEKTPSGQIDVLASIKDEAGGTTFISGRPKSRINYIICMLPRTGSTMFCSILEKTQLLGYPDEYLNPRGVVQLYARQYLPGNVHEYIDILRRERATNNGVFGLKTTIDDFGPIIDAQLVRELLSPVRFIFLDREDIVLQAVSGVIAQQSGVWHRGVDFSPYRSTKIAEPTFDEAAIIATLDLYTRMRVTWERFFAIHSITPLRLTYEKILANTNETVSQLAAALDIELESSVDLSMSITSRLADQRSYEWANMIRDKYRARIG